MVKNTLNMIISILVIILLSSFIWGYNIFGIKDSTMNMIDKFSSNIKFEIECPQNITPSEIDLAMSNNKLSGYEIKEVRGFEDFVYTYINPKWLDGEEMSIYPPDNYGEVIDFSKSHCIKGNAEGQNINYYYCDLGYSKTTTEISEDGDIGETITISYNIKLTLRKLEHLRSIRGYSIDRYSIIDSSCILI